MASTGPSIFEDSTTPPKSVLNTFLHPKIKRKPIPESRDYIFPRAHPGQMPPPPLLPPDHPHSRRALIERSAPNASNSHQFEDPEESRQKKPRSTAPLKALRREWDRGEATTALSEREQADKNGPKKTRSATGLSSILKRSQRGKKNQESPEKTKENMTPTTNPLPSPQEVRPLPIWAQFATQPLQDQSASTPSVGQRVRTIDEEMSLYTPKGYSPSNQRNFHDYQPSLRRRPEQKPRPKTEYVPGTLSFKDILSAGQRPSHQENRAPARSFMARAAEIESHGPQRQERGKEPQAARGSRIMSTINAFNHKAKQNTEPALQPAGPDTKEVEDQYERLLDSRNVPGNMREKMRSLDLSIKADFVMKHRVGKTDGKEISAPRTEDDDKNSSRSRNRSRSRGRALTSLADSSPAKKIRSGTFSSHKRGKSADLPRPGSSRSMASNGSTSSFRVQPDSTADPVDFVQYLRQTQTPETAEVGKLHKLRLLLRNETVEWVDSFITRGGMDEVVQFLYRILKIEWREDHEDQLLHETLLCLKALSTTSVAMLHLVSIQDVLFPTLLGMLFDKENKGPSEFTTRGIIITLLFFYLSAASIPERPIRAQKIMSYIRDPTPPEDQQPLSFIANIYQNRPYRDWCKEVSDVSKEVFWIFLHQANVVPILAEPEHNDEPFAVRRYPPPRPPVPSAPYVGGVEWDATNYIAAHLDLMNGLIASLPTAADRNAFRTELRASGFEKVMGGSLRTCKEKFYFSVHDGLKLWVTAASEDGWEFQTVREGPPRDAPKSPVKSSPKKKPLVGDEPPKLDFKVSLTPAPKKELGDDWI